MKTTTATEYLVELDALDAADRPIVLRYSGAGLMTLPTDVPANTHYHPRVVDPGNLERHLFSDGRTFGDFTGSVGEIRLENVDAGLDHLKDYAFDGRAFRLYSIDAGEPFAARRLRNDGAIAHIEFREGQVVIGIRDWLDALRSPLQEALYKGSTIQGGMAEAEGAADLKDKRKSLLFGSRPHFGLVLVDPHDHVYEAGSNGFAGVPVVRDRGVRLTFAGEFATIAAMKAATAAAGQFVTCARLGLVRLGGRPLGAVTASVTEGASVAARTAGQIAKRILLRSGMVDGVDFLSADIEELDRLAPYECGVWIPAGSERTRLDVLTQVLRSVRASCTPDAAGVYRIRRFSGPAAVHEGEITEEMAIGEEEDLQRDASADQTDGLPVKTVTIRFAQNDAVFGPNDLDVNAEATFLAFVGEEWRQVARTAEATARRHLHAHEITIDTVLCHEADALTELAAWLALYSIGRAVYRTTIRTGSIAVDLGTTKRLVADRFDLRAGRNVVVIGLVDRLNDEESTLAMWG